MKESVEYNPTLSFGLLLQGPPKRGKTTILLSFPKVYIADCDNNLVGAVRFLKKKDPNLRFKYDTINVADTSELCKSWGLKDGEAVPSHLRWTRLVECCKAAAKDSSIITLGVDSLASVDQYLQDHIVANKAADKEKQMTISDWIPYKNMMTKFVTTFRSANKLFVMTSHEIAEKNEDGSGVIMYKPAMASKLQDNFGGFFSDVWQCEAEKFGSDWKFYVKTMPQARRALGNSLGLPEDFAFSWEAFKPYLDQLGGMHSFSSEQKIKDLPPTP